MTETNSNSQTPITPDEPKTLPNPIPVEDAITLEQTEVESLIQLSQEFAAQMKRKGYYQMPTLETFIGKDVERIVVSTKEKAFLIHRPSKVTTLSFYGRPAKQIIDFIMRVLPSVLPKFKETDLYKDLASLHLLGYLAQAKPQTSKQARDNFLLGSLSTDDVFVVYNGNVLGKIRDFTKDDLINLSIFEEQEVDGEMKYLPREGIQFVAAKDTNPRNLGTLHSLFQRQSGSLNYARFCKVLGKSADELMVAKTVVVNGKTQEILKRMKATLLEEIAVMDSGATLPFEEMNPFVLAAIFAEISVLHSEDGELPKNITGVEVYKTYKSYAKSPSQDRSGQANMFDSLNSQVTYYRGTGQTEKTYAKQQTFEIKDVAGNVHEKVFNVVDVGKAYKRFMVGASNGVSPELGLLSTFSDCEVNYIPSGKGITIGEIQPGSYVLKNQAGETITLTILNDYYTTLGKDQAFLIGVLDQTNALIGVEKFSYWNEEAQKEILKREVTDGQGWHSSRITKELRAAGCLNSFDSYQLRFSNAIKGATFEFDPICTLFQSDIVLTKGMVKSENILEDLQQNGFQLYVVGQRKDAQDGVWLASQGLQLLDLTVEELKIGVDRSIDYAKKAFKGKSVAGLSSLLNILDEASDSEFKMAKFLRLAKEKQEVLNEQAILNEVKSLTVQEMNKLLNAKLFFSHARNRYMFTDPFAILSAAKAGRYEILPEDGVLQPFEVVCPSQKASDETFFLETGEAMCNRFPVGAPHQQPIVTAVDAQPYRPYIEQGLWQGCIFFDAYSWVVPMMSGADHDGDMCVVIFDEMLVFAIKRRNQRGSAGLPMLPLIDAYVVKDEEGNITGMGKGCPTYVPEGKEIKKEEEWTQYGPFEVKGFQIRFTDEVFEGEQAETNRRLFLELQAEMAHKITIKNIEKNMIGMIANYIMILTDLLSRATLNPELLTPHQIKIAQKDRMKLCKAGEWEIDRPKHGGAYMEMPSMKRLFKIFSPLMFDEDQLAWSNEKKWEHLLEVKGFYHLLFGAVMVKRQIIGFQIKKPNWLASQKEEYGKFYEDSVFEIVFGNHHSDQLKSYAEEGIEELCHFLKEEHSNNTQNSINRLVAGNMEITDLSFLQLLKENVSVLLDIYSAQERARAKEQHEFMEEKIEVLKDMRVWRKKNIRSLTRDKKSAQVRKLWPMEMQSFTFRREFLKEVMHKDLYKMARQLQVDPRLLVGAMYLVLAERRTDPEISYKKDGRLYRFNAQNGNIHLPFDVFHEEMYSLLSGKISQTYFMPMDIKFITVNSYLIPSTDGVRVRVTNPDPRFAGKSFDRNDYRFVAVRKESQPNGEERTIINFLNPGTEKTPIDQLTKEHTFYRGILHDKYHAQYPEGVYEILVERIVYDGTGETAIVYFG